MVIIHVNHLTADGSHEISNLILFFKKATKLKVLFSANFQWHFFI